MSAFNHYAVELNALAPDRLGDPGALSAVVVAAAGAVGMAAQGPPVVRQGPDRIAVALLCHDGHIVLHSMLTDRCCLIDIVARVPADVTKGVDVIMRRLAP